MRGRRISGRRRASKSGRRSMNARQKESARNASATLKKHYRLLKKVSARYYRKQHLERSKIVVLRLCGVVVLLIRSPQHLHQHLTAAAAKYFSHGSFGSRFVAYVYRSLHQKS